MGTLGDYVRSMDSAKARDPGADGKYDLKFQFFPGFLGQSEEAIQP
jgi:hypothetical protein